MYSQQESDFKYNDEDRLNAKRMEKDIMVTLSKRKLNIS